MPQTVLANRQQTITLSAQRRQDQRALFEFSFFFSTTRFFLEERSQMLVAVGSQNERSKPPINAEKLWAMSGPVESTDRCQCTAPPDPPRYHDPSNEDDLSRRKTSVNVENTKLSFESPRLPRSTIDLKLRFVSRTQHLTTLVTHQPRCTLTSLRVVVQPTRPTGRQRSSYKRTTMSS